MTTLFTSKVLKTTLAFSVAMWVGTTAFAQANKNQARSSQNFTSLFSGVSGATAKVSALVSRPGNSQDFVATGPGAWLHESNSAYMYDSQGRLTQRLYTDPSTSQNMGRTIITYDSHGAEIENKTEQWQGSGWVMRDGYRTAITYNTAGQKQETISQYWDNSTNTWQNDFREQFTYDTNNLVADITNSEWDNGAWVLTDRMVLNNTAGTATSLVIQEYMGTWQDVLRAQNVIWHVLYETPSSYEMQAYDSGNWINMEKYQATYDVNGGHVGVYEEWNPQTNTWEKNYRETETYDSNRNYTGWKDESWDPATSTWTLDGEEKEILTYSGIDITQRIIQDSWGSTSSTLQDREKEVYSNFQTFNVSGIKNNLLSAEVNVYPNPTQHVLNISFPENRGAFTATVLDVTGKTLLTQTFNAANKNQLNLETLPTGIYLLQLQTEAGSITKRIVKQ